MFQKSVFYRYIAVFSKQIPVFVWAFVYFCALYFVNSNLSFLLCTLLFFILLYILLKDIRQAMFLMFIASLPFAKGKSFDFILLLRNQIPQFGLYDVGYYFPLYPSLVFLMGTIYLIFRKKNDFTIGSHTRTVLSVFGIFIFIACISGLTSAFPVVVVLSVVQLICMGCIYVLPYWLQLKKVTQRYISHILSAFILFESMWVVAQAIYRGPLGRYIEATLPLNRLGILSTEDAGFMRFNGTFFEPSILGTFMLMHVFYFGILLWKKQQVNIVEQVIYTCSIMCALLSIIFTGSRGIYGLFIVLLVLTLRVYAKTFMNSIRTIRYPRIVVLGSLLLLCIFSPYISKRIQTAPTLFGVEGSGTFRLQLNSYATRLATTHVFGVGLNLSPYYFALGFPQERTIDPSHPHNLYFQILAETGFPGLIVFILFLWVVYRKFSIRHTISAEPYFAASLIYLLAALFYPMFISQPEILSYFFLHAGLMNWTLQMQHYES